MAAMKPRTGDGPMEVTKEAVKKLFQSVSVACLALTQVLEFHLEMIASLSQALTSQQDQRLHCPMVR